MNQFLQATWNYPTSIHVGAGKVNELGKLCHQIDLTTVLLVTDPGLVQLPFCQQLIANAQQSGLTIPVFSNIQSNPTGENVNAGVDVYRHHHCQGVIALGGGSAIDAGKAIALMSGQELPLWTFEDVGDNWRKIRVDGIAPSIAIPTTAGTGSEVGRASVITDAKHQVKRIIFHPLMLPKQVILDPELSASLPAPLTAATGMDALSHSLEAYCAKGYHPMADGIAMQAMAMVKDNLLKAYQDGHNLEARTHLLVASAMGATAFQKGLGAMHALAHPLGAVYNAHHGRLNAILMPYVLMANRPAIQSRIETITPFLKIANGFNGFVDWIIELRRSLAIEPCLRDIGIDEAHVERIAYMATEDAAAACNPVSFTAADYEQILLAAIDGKVG
ncbi:iron-containing alcohol dehydrogenase [Legionella sp. W05-934-2]|jgi:alcohol dehydrogenase class IV|uniref:iron-containing alcohol dehydrogenase n=1 Tax=Legionella sp. W05-934-2 TaxID=1198649 RepID=UPI0034617F45